MKKIGIVIDKWKFKIFARVLHEAGYGYERGPGITKDTYNMYVKISDDEVDKLTEVVRVANNRAAKSKDKRWL